MMTLLQQYSAPVACPYRLLLGLYRHLPLSSRIAQIGLKVERPPCHAEQQLSHRPVLHSWLQQTGAGRQEALRELKTTAINTCETLINRTNFDSKTSHTQYQDL